ncbi:MAG TPA: FAD-dependent oxidoreductase [Cyclobacteriaceae bacterium]|jgi:glycine/D-amino acid oxidase-like deaminating enzyme|nr:FAD-dependent oxidoreductase [Cyclobacteriaceae bacterium]
MSKPNINTFAPTSQVKKSVRLNSLDKGSSVIVIGAGAFGGWSALYLQRLGFNVTLIDTWGAGNSRSSSGDETRIIRSTYGANETYFDMNVRALQLWKENEKLFDKKLFYNTGVLWFCYEEKTPLVDDSIPFAQKHQADYIYLTRQELARQYPLVQTDDLHHAFLDSHGGLLKARESCLAVQEAFVKEGGRYIQAHVVPGKIQFEKLSSIHLSNGLELKADAYLFACGSWLGSLFPELKDVITCTRQEVYYVGVPSTHSQEFENFPTWIDVDGKDFYYGIAHNGGRGFKIGVDKRGDNFNPSDGNRILNQEVLAKASEFLAHRFPLLKNAPLLENRVCPYENSPDGNFIFDQHPEADNIIILGGGSGHGFKHGPALGELIANVLQGNAKVPDIFALNRFSS